MRKLFIVLFLYFTGFIAQGQNLTVEGAAPKLYVTHTVAPKENFYSISRLYNQPPKSIASFNQITMQKGLAIGQLVKVPLDEQNFDSESSNADGKRIPLTHVVANGENIFKIGTDLHVTAQAIRKWNNLTSDKITPGTSLIVGFLKTNSTDLSSLKTRAAAAVNTNPAVEKGAEETGKQIASDEKKDEPFVSVSTDSTTNDKQEETKAQPKGYGATTNSTAIAEKDTALAVAPESATVTKTEAVKQPEVSATKTEGIEKGASANESSSNSPAGSFQEIYTQQASKKTRNTISGQAATFKSTSGWQDKKYYVLMNNVSPGTIVKISLSDSKAVYAKVLGSMPEMKENTGLLLRISNAAASNLGIIDPKFPVQISYYQ